MDKKILENMWAETLEEFMNKPSWSVNDLAILEKGNLWLHFWKPNLATFGSNLRWSLYGSNEALRNEFNRQAKAISLLFSAVDVLIVPDLGSVGLFDEEKIFTVEEYRQKAKGNKLFAFELE